MALVQHITGVGRTRRGRFLIPAFAGAAHDSPVPEQKKAAATKKDTVFDPAAFAAKLAFTDEVADLGISEEDATRLQSASRTERFTFPFGTISGFIGFADGELKMPPQWIRTNSRN